MTAQLGLGVTVSEAPWLMDVYDTFGRVLVFFWACFGMFLFFLRYGLGHILVWFWHGFGTVYGIYDMVCEIVEFM